MPKPTYVVFRDKGDYVNWQVWSGTEWLPCDDDTPYGLYRIAEPTTFLDEIAPNRYERKYDAEGWRYWFIDCGSPSEGRSTVPSGEQPCFG